MKVLLLMALLTASGCDGSPVAGLTGQNVTLPCKYDIKTNRAVHVCWGRGELPSSKCNNQLLSTDGYKVIQESGVSSRYQLLGRLDEGDVSLTILDLREEDAGRYGCRAEIPGLFSDEKHHIDLTVERAPDPTTSPPSATQTFSERPAAAQTTADQLTTESLLTSCSDSNITAECQQEGSMLTVVLVVVLVTAAGLFIMARGPEPPAASEWTRTSCVYQRVVDVRRPIQQLEIKTSEALYCCSQKMEAAQTVSL
ncbi:hepatitis A virus cellular receptor 1-like isoform 1-T1 [Anableps anableps]